MTRKINTTDPIPYDLPYQTIYAERIPLLHIFRTALATKHISFSKSNTLLKNLHKFAELLSNPHYLAAECGVYMGNGIIACAEIAKQYGLPVHIYGLDTFTGLPELSDNDKLYASELVLRKASQKMFADTSVKQVQRKIDEKKLTKYITLVPGLFQDTLATLPDKKYFFVNIDCDLYEPHLECLDFFYTRIEKGGIVFFDDYHSVQFMMARKAIDKFMDGRPEQLFHLRFGEDKTNHTKTFFIKY